MDTGSQSSLDLNAPPNYDQKLGQAWKQELWLQPGNAEPTWSCLAWNAGQV